MPFIHSTLPPSSSHSLKVEVILYIPSILRQLFLEIYCRLFMYVYKQRIKYIIYLRVGRSMIELLLFWRYNFFANSVDEKRPESRPACRIISL